MLKIVQIVLNKFAGANRNIMLLFNRMNTVSWLLQTIFIDVTFSSACFASFYCRCRYVFIWGCISQVCHRGRGQKNFFCLIEHFFFISANTKSIFCSPSPERKKNPLPPPWGKISSDAKHGLRWSSRFRPLALLKERKFAFCQKERFHWCRSRDIL